MTDSVNKRHALLKKTGMVTGTILGIVGCLSAGSAGTLWLLDKIYTRHDQVVHWSDMNHLQKQFQIILLSHDLKKLDVYLKNEDDQQSREILKTIFESDLESLNNGGD